MARRSQRSEVCNETRVVMNMDIPLSHTHSSWITCCASMMKQIAFVINMTQTSEIGTHLGAFKHFTTRYRPIKEVTVTFITLIKGCGSDRIEDSPSRRAQLHFKRGPSYGFHSIH